MEWILKEMAVPVFVAIIMTGVCAGLGFLISELNDWTHWLALAGGIVGLALGILVARRIGDYYVREEERAAERLRAG